MKRVGLLAGLLVCVLGSGAVAQDDEGETVAIDSWVFPDSDPPVAWMSDADFCTLLTGNLSLADAYCKGTIEGFDGVVFLPESYLAGLGREPVKDLPYPFEFELPDVSEIRAAAEAEPEAEPGGVTCMDVFAHVAASAPSEYVARLDTAFAVCRSWDEWLEAAEAYPDTVAGEPQQFAITRCILDEEALADTTICRSLATAGHLPARFEGLPGEEVTTDTGIVLTEAMVEAVVAEVTGQSPAPSLEPLPPYVPEDLASILPDEVAGRDLVVTTWTPEQVLENLGDESLRALLRPFDREPSEIHIATSRDRDLPGDGLNIMAARVEGVDGAALVQPFIDVLFAPQAPPDTPRSELDPDWREVDGRRVGAWDDLLDAGAGWILFYPKGEVLFLVAQNQSGLTMEAVLTGLP